MSDSSGSSTGKRGTAKTCTSTKKVKRVHTAARRPTAIKKTPPSRLEKAPLGYKSFLPKTDASVSDGSEGTERAREMLSPEAISSSGSETSVSAPGTPQLETVDTFTHTLLESLGEPRTRSSSECDVRPLTSEIAKSRSEASLLRITAQLRAA